MHSRFMTFMLLVPVELFWGTATMPIAAADPVSRVKQGPERFILDPLLGRTLDDPVRGTACASTATGVSRQGN